MRSRNFNRKFSKYIYLVGLELPNLGLLTAGPSSYPLDHDVLVERIILELPDEVYGQGILTELGGRAI